MSFSHERPNPVIPRQHITECEAVRNNSVKRMTFEQPSHNTPPIHQQPNAYLGGLFAERLEEVPLGT